MVRRESFTKDDKPVKAVAALSSGSVLSSTNKAAAKKQSELQSAFEAMSRRSTANSNFGASEQGTPGGLSAQTVPGKAEDLNSSKRMGSQGRYRRDSAKQLRNSNTEKSILQEASEEVITLSLDPKAGKKKKQIPRQLKPLPNLTPGSKI